MALPVPDPDSTCLVTGASSGIGEQFARGLARRGYNLTLTARRKDRLENLARELQQTTGIQTSVIASDLSDAKARQRLVKDVDSRGQTVAVLINCAGLGSGGRFTGLDRDGELLISRVNVEAVVDLCGVYATRMADRGSGAILNVASTAAFAPLPRQATYAASKAFVLSFSDALHAELKQAGVLVSALCPGPTSTEFAQAAGPAVHNAMEGLPPFVTTSAHDVAEAGLRSLERGSRRATVGFFNRVSELTAHLTPRSVELAAMSRLYPVRA
jgi:uncharacterized protein